MEPYMERSNAGLGNVRPAKNPNVAHEHILDYL
jgi:hypothetical protein